MKTFVISFCVLSASVRLFAQGLVNFVNTPTTLVSVQANELNGPYSLMTGPAGSYYFGLFFGLPNNGNYTFTGIYATNTGVDGQFSGGVVAVPGWAAGVSKTFFVAGWDASMGHDFNPLWFFGSPTVFGASFIGSGAAGDGLSTPALNLFGPNTIQFGFRLNNSLVPEPSIAALLAVATAAILVRRIKRRNR